MCGMINFVWDAIWTCKDRIKTQIPIVLFKHHMSNYLAQVNFCTLANNASCSSKREHIPHKNDTKSNRRNKYLYRRNFSDESFVTEIFIITTRLKYRGIEIVWNGFQATERQTSTQKKLYLRKLKCITYIF